MMKIKRSISIIITLSMLLSLLTGCFLFEDDLQIEDETYAPYDTSSTYTLMIYLCGADLESWWGAATTELREMIEGYTGNESVNIIVQTGGANYWQNPIVSNEKCQRYKVTKNTIELIDDSVGKACMSKSDTLSKFITYTSQEYPADRYGLILWNHGGGSAGGYGYDEIYDSEMMSLADFSSALKECGLTYDFIGFDACLMGGFETCLAVAPYTKYLIASQESEPNCGWYYKDWIRKLATTPSIDTVEIGKSIVSTYIEKAYEDAPSQYCTLGIFDTQKIVENVLPLINNLSSGYTKQLENGDYADVSRIRSSLREMSDANDYVDLYSLAVSNESTQLQSALTEATVYFETTDNGAGDNGLSIYYPYHDLSYIDYLEDIYESFDYEVDFDDYIDIFANIMADGQVILDSDVDEDIFSIFEWFDEENDLDEIYNSDYYNKCVEDYNSVEIIEKGDNYILKLTDSDWEGISNITLNCIAMYDGFYIDFGADDYCDFDDEGNLIVGYDKRWVAIDGCIVPFYFEEHYYDDDNNLLLTYGYVPCRYNGKDAELVVAWDTEKPDGYVAGVRYNYDNPLIASKGMASLNDGDIIEPYYDKYDENMEYTGTITIEGEKIEVKGELTVSYEDVSEQLGDTYVYYEIFDLFNNSYTTESVYYPK